MSSRDAAVQAEILAEQNQEFYDVISEVMPAILIQSIMLDSVKKGETSSLKVSLSMLAADKVENDIFSEWFLNEEYASYLNAYVIESHNASMTKFVTENYDNLRLDGINHFFKNLPFKDGYDYQWSPVDFPLKSILDKNNNALSNENYKTVDDAGNSTIQIPIKIDFTSIDENPQHLAYFVFLTFDLTTLGSKFGISTSSTDIVLSEKVVSEIVIDGGSVVSEAQILVDTQTNEPFTGPFHVNTDATYSADKDNHSLTLIKFPNYKVQDMRLAHFLKDKTLPNETFSSSFSEKTKILVDNFYSIEKSPEEILDFIKSGEDQKSSFSKYFSDLMITSDKDGVARFQFFFDKFSFLTDAAYYKPIITKENKELLDKAILQNISIFRVRKDLNDGTIFNEERTPEFVTSNISEAILDGIDSHYIKSFSVVDKSAKDINFGLYDYKIVFQVIDPSVDFIRQQIDLVQNSVLTFQNYLSLSLSNKKIIDQSVVPYFDNFTNQFVADFKNVTSNIPFKQAFNDFMSVFLVFSNETTQTLETISSLVNLFDPTIGTPEGIKIVLETMETFLTNLSGLVGSQDPLSPSKLAIKKTRNVLDIAHSFSSENLVRYDATKRYDTIFDASRSDGAGYELLSTIRTQEFGLNSIKASDLATDVAKESSKFFKTEAQFNYKEQLPTLDDFYNIDDNPTKTIFSYVTANKVLLPKSIADISTYSYSDDDKFLNLFLDIVNYNTSKLANLGKHNLQKNSSLTIGQQETRFKLIQLIENFADLSAFDSVSLSQTGIADVQNYFNIFGTIAPPLTVVVDKVADESNQILKETFQDEFNNDTNPNSLLLSLLLDYIVGKQGDNVENLSFLSPTLEGNKNEQFFVDQKRAAAAISLLFSGKKSFDNSYLQTLPNAIKAAILSATKGLLNVNVFEDQEPMKIPEKFFKNWLFFKNIFSIEYLSGFTDGDIRKPNWLLLTDPNKVKNKVLCRFNKFKIDGFEQFVPDISLIDLPVVNEFFYLSFDGPVAIPVSNMAPVVQNKNAVDIPAVVSPVLVASLPSIIANSSTNFLAFNIPVKTASVTKRVALQTNIQREESTNSRSQTPITRAIKRG